MMIPTRRMKQLPQKARKATMPESNRQIRPHPNLRANSPFLPEAVAITNAPLFLAFLRQTKQLRQLPKFFRRIRQFGLRSETDLDLPTTPSFSSTSNQSLPTPGSSVRT